MASFKLSYDGLVKNLFCSMSFAKDFFRVHQVLIRQKFIFIKLTIEGLDLCVKSKNDPNQQSNLISY